MGSIRVILVIVIMWNGYLTAQLYEIDETLIKVNDSIKLLATALVEVNAKANTNKAH